MKLLRLSKFQCLISLIDNSLNINKEITVQAKCQGRQGACKMNKDWACSSGDKPYRQAAPVVHEHAQQLGLQLFIKVPWNSVCWHENSSPLFLIDWKCPLPCTAGSWRERMHTYPAPCIPPYLIVMASKKGTYPTFWIPTMIVLTTVLNGNQNYSNLTKLPAKQGGEQNVCSIHFPRSWYLISEVSVCAMYCHLGIFQPSAAQCDKIPAWQKHHSYDRYPAE